MGKKERKEKKEYAIYVVLAYFILRGVWDANF